MMTKNQITHYKQYWKEYNVQIVPCVGKKPPKHWNKKRDIPISNTHNNIGISLVFTPNICILDIDRSLEEVLKRWPFLKKFPSIWHYEKDGQSIKKIKFCLPKSILLDYIRRNKIPKQSYYKNKELDIGELLVNSFAVIPPSTHPETGQPYRWSHFRLFKELAATGTSPVCEKYRDNIYQLLEWFLGNRKPVTKRSKKRHKKGIENCYIASYIRRSKQWHDPIPIVGKMDDEIFQDLFTICRRLAAAEAGDPIWGNSLVTRWSVTKNPEYKPNGVVQSWILKEVGQTTFDLLTNFRFWIWRQENIPYSYWKTMVELGEKYKKWLSYKIRYTIRDGLWAGYEEYIHELLPRKLSDKNHRRMWTYAFYILITMEREGLIRAEKPYTIRRLTKEVIRFYWHRYKLDLSPWKKKLLTWLKQLIRKYGKSSDIMYRVDPEQKDIKKKMVEVNLAPLLTAYTPDGERIILDRDEADAISLLSGKEPNTKLYATSVVVFHQEFFNKLLAPEWAQQKKYLPQPVTGFQEQFLEKLMQEHPVIEHGTRHKKYLGKIKALLSRYNRRLVKDIISLLTIYLDPTQPFIDGPMGYKSRVSSKKLLDATQMALAPRAYSRESVVGKKLLGWRCQEHHHSYSHWSKWYLQQVAQLQDIVDTIATREYPELYLNRYSHQNATREINWNRMWHENYVIQLQRELKQLKEPDPELEKELVAARKALQEMELDLEKQVEKLLRQDKKKRFSTILSPLLQAKMPLLRAHLRGHPRGEPQLKKWSQDSYQFRKKFQHTLPWWRGKWNPPTFSRIFALECSTVSYRRPWRVTFPP